MTAQRTRVNSSRAADRSFFAGLFAGIAEEMGVTLGRAAYSPNIKERKDFSCAAFDAEGRMVAQAAHIPVHLGAMPLSVEAAFEHATPFRPGDVVLLNDPFAGGTHLPDLTLVTPVFASQGRLFGFLASRAHHADVGGMTPGSLPLSTEIYQEGIRIPPVKLYDAGQLNKALLQTVLANVRTPLEREGDLRAQCAAHETGSSRMIESADRFGVATLHRHMADLLTYGESLMRATLARIPDGTYRFQDVLDGDGVHDRPLAIRVRLSVRNGMAHVDFDGTDPASAGCMNAVPAVTMAAVRYCFLCLLVTPSRLHTDPVSSPPINAGSFAPIRISLPENSLVNAALPHAVAGGNVETSQRIVDVVFGALSKALPDLIPAASQGTMNNLTLGGRRPGDGRPFAYYETIAGGMGARPGADGLNAVHTHMTNTLNTPIEALEFSFPFRVERYEIRAKPGGAGRWHGGKGVRRDVRVLCDASGALLTDRRTSCPYGLCGGEDGPPGSNVMIRDGKTIRLPSKCGLQLQAGDVISIRTPGGGGYGKKH